VNWKKKRVSVLVQKMRAKEEKYGEGTAIHEGVTTPRHWRVKEKRPRIRPHPTEKECEPEKSGGRNERHRRKAILRHVWGPTYRGQGETSGLHAAQGSSGRESITIERQWKRETKGVRGVTVSSRRLSRDPLRGGRDSEGEEWLHAQYNKEKKKKID